MHRARCEGNLQQLHKECTNPNQNFETVYNADDTSLVSMSAGKLNELIRHVGSIVPLPVLDGSLHGCARHRSSSPIRQSGGSR